MVKQLKVQPVTWPIIQLPSFRMPTQSGKKHLMHFQATKVYSNWVRPDNKKVDAVKSIFHNIEMECYHAKQKRIKEEKTLVFKILTFFRVFQNSVSSLSVPCFLVMVSGVMTAAEYEEE